MRYIIHVDMDAFFAAIEQRDNPVLQGKPVIVGADPKKGKGRGVVSTCSYEARKFGVCSAMPISVAYRKCPQGIFLPVDMEKYCLVSEDIFKIFYSFTPKIEPISIDEAFLDIRGSYHIFGTPLKTAQLIKAKIKKEVCLTASVGIASTKMVAKIASDIGKPDGLVEVDDNKLIDFLWPLEIDKICGLGGKSKVILNRMGVYTIGDLAKTELSKMREVFGKHGEHFWGLAKGIDDREVEEGDEIKSISNETTFDVDIADNQKIKARLMSLSEKVSDRLRSNNFKARTIILKIRLNTFRTYTRSITLSESTNFVEVIYKVIENLFENFDCNNHKVRLIGVKATNMISALTKDNLFSKSDDCKREKMHKTLDAIKEKFGRNSIHRAASMS